MRIGFWGSLRKFRRISLYGGFLHPLTNTAMLYSKPWEKPKFPLILPRRPWLFSSKCTKTVYCFHCDLPPKGSSHNKPLYITVICRSKWIPLVLVDNGSTLNVCPQRTPNKIGIDVNDLRPSSQGVRGYDSAKRNVMRCITLLIKIGEVSKKVEFHVMDIPASFNLLLGRPWLHDMGAIASTLHQKVKFLDGNKIITVLGGSSIWTHSDNPVQEVEAESKDTFLTGFSIEEVVAVQTLMAEKSCYVSVPATRMMKKYEYLPGLGLRKRSQGIPQMINFPHNQNAFWPWLHPYKWGDRTKKERGNEEGASKKRRKDLEGRMICCPKDPQMDVCARRTRFSVLWIRWNLGGCN